MAARAALLAAAALFAFLLGWVVAPAPRASAEAGRSLRLADLRLDAPGAAAARAAAELARSHGAVAAPAIPHLAVATAAQPMAAPPPSPPQADAVLRAQIAAVEGQDGDLRLVLASARRLKAGDGFMGWRLAALSRTSAVLVRGRERRSVEFFAPARPADAALAGAAARLAPPSAVRAQPAPTAAEFFSGFKG